MSTLKYYYVNIYIIGRFNERMCGALMHVSAVITMLSDKGRQ